MHTIQRLLRRAVLPTAAAAALLVTPAAAIAAGSGHAPSGALHKWHLIRSGELAPLTSQIGKGVLWSARTHPAAGPEGSGSCPITVGGQSGAGICGTNPLVLIYSNGSAVQEELIIVGLNRAIWHTFGFVNSSGHAVGTWATWSSLNGIANDGVWLTSFFNQIQVRGQDDALWCNTQIPGTVGGWNGWGRCSFLLP